MRFQKKLQKKTRGITGLLFKQQLEFNYFMVNKENNVLFENKTQDKEQFGRNQYMVPVFVKNHLIKLVKLRKF